MTYQQILSIQSRGRGTYDISREISQIASDSGIQTGLCHIYLRHTSASLILCENADPEVRDDLERFMVRLVPDGDPLFRHMNEGADDMPAHIRSILTNMDLTLPVVHGRLALGTWQGVYLYEHRARPHRRELVITFEGK